MVKKVGWLLHSLLILYSVGKWEEKVIEMEGAGGWEPERNGNLPSPPLRLALQAVSS